MQVQVLLPEPWTLMRGRLTVGLDALNVLVLVRFQPPQLKNGSHPAATNPPPADRCPGACLENRCGHSVVGSSPTASAPKRAVPWSSGNDSWPTPRQRRFKSVRDYLRPATPIGRAAWLKPK